jgi:hypothetical protein
MPAHITKIYTWWQLLISAVLDYWFQSFGLPCFARAYQYYIINLHEAANLKLPEGEVHSPIKRLSVADRFLPSLPLPSFILLLQTVPPTWLYIHRFPSVYLASSLIISLNLHRWTKRYTDSYAHCLPVSRARYKLLFRHVDIKTTIASSSKFWSAVSLSISLFRKMGYKLVWRGICH